MLKYGLLAAVKHKQGAVFCGKWEGLSMLSNIKLGLRPTGIGPEKESAVYHRELRTNRACEADSTAVATLLDDSFKKAKCLWQLLQGFLKLKPNFQH